MISYYTKVHLSKCNVSWVVSRKQTMNFNIQTAAMFVFLTKMVLLKVVHPLKIYHYTKFNGPMLNDANCIHLRNLNVCHFGIADGLVSHSRSRQAMEKNIKIRHKSFILYSFYSTIHKSPYHRRYMITAVDKVSLNKRVSITWVQWHDVTMNLPFHVY
jgi:hypothetical protein